MSLRLRKASCAALLVLGVLLSACGARNPYFDASRAHHTPDGFKNNYIAAADKSIGQLLRWRWEALRDGLPRPAQAPTPRVAPDLAEIHANARLGANLMQPAVTWIGHASMLVQASGLNVLTDPAFSERASPLSFLGPQRAQAPGVALADLPPIDVVVISHNHYDHLDEDSIRGLNARANGTTLFLVPLGLKPWLADIGVTNVIELDWWQQHETGGVKFHLTPVQHWSARGLTDRNRSLWGGWAVIGSGFHWYFSGDSGYSPDFRDTRQHFYADAPDSFDLALIAVGAYEPRWFMRDQHVNPAEAVQVHRDLGARRSIGVHWGTFNLTDEPLDQPPGDLAIALAQQAISPQDFVLLKIGETRTLPHRAPTLPPTGTIIAP
jgi:N-acyl-phosphatidylethanolamine-hydrolysing phospholipase D